MYVLDTDYVVLFQRGSGVELQRLLQRMALYPDTAFFYPVIAFHEQMLGANAYIAQAQTRDHFVRGYGMLQPPTAAPPAWLRTTSWRSCGGP
jgi:hypothetical protein